MTSDLGPLPSAPDVPPWGDRAPKLDNFVGSYRSGGQGPSGGSHGERYPHIRDLQAKASSPELSSEASVGSFPIKLRAANILLTIAVIPAKRTTSNCPRITDTIKRIDRSGPAGSGLRSLPSIL